MSFNSALKKLWNLLWKDDSLKGWIISIVVIFILVKFVLFPTLNLVTGTKLPLVVVESCSMYHQNNIATDFDSWFSTRTIKYGNLGIIKEDFNNYKLRDGFNKGDIILAFGVKKEKIKQGDILIFTPNKEALKSTPIIHRVVKFNNSSIQTLGDNNAESLTPSNNLYKIDETNTSTSQVIGKAVFKIPYLGWAKLIFFDWKKPEGERGFCR